MIDTSVTTAASGSPNAARVRSDGIGGASARGGGTTRTRPGAKDSSAEAVKRDGAQMSCTNRMPACQSGGTDGSSHAQ